MLDMIDGLDMFSLDVLHLKNGEEIVLELNDSSMVIFKIIIGVNV
jgi:hypothetical protein